MSLSSGVKFRKRRLQCVPLIKKEGIRMLVASELSVKQKKRAMRLKKKQQLGQELPEVRAGRRR